MATAQAEAIESFKSIIGCGICFEIKELRQLPCQHSICMTCLGKVQYRSTKTKI